MPSLVSEVHKLLPACRVDWLVEYFSDNMSVPIQ
jgi:hypothetical protein